MEAAGSEGYLESSILPERALSGAPNLVCRSCFVLQARCSPARFRTTESQGAVARWEQLAHSVTYSCDDVTLQLAPYHHPARVSGQISARYSHGCTDRRLGSAWK